MTIKFPRSTRIEVELTSKCTLLCPKCPRTLMKDRRREWDNGHLDADVLLNAIDDRIQIVNFAGSFGDPIYHPDLVKIFQGLKAKGKTINMDTNGSYRKADDWHAMGSVLDDSDWITFSVDGPLDNFTTYRVNGDAKTIEEGMRIMCSYAGRIRWKYIVFRYNSTLENLIKAYEQAWDFGIRQFMLVHTTRAEDGQHVEVAEFSQHLDDLEEYVSTLSASDRLHGNRPPQLRIQITPRVRKTKEVITSQRQPSKEEVINSSDTVIKTGIKRAEMKPIFQLRETVETEYVKPQCINVIDFSHFIGSNGAFLPCCFMRSEYASPGSLNDSDLDQISIYKHSIDDIIKSEAYQRLLADFDSVQVCRNKCKK